MRAPEAIAACLLLSACASAPVQVSPPGAHAYEVSVAVAPPRAAVAWYGHTDGRDVISFEWLDRRGGPRTAPVPVSTGEGSAYEPDLQLMDGRPVVTWYEKTPGGALSAWLAMLGPDGKALWRTRLDAAGGNARNPVMRIVKGAPAVAWIETPTTGEPGVWVQRFSADGKPAGPPVRAADASMTTWNLNATTDAKGRFYVTYDAGLGAKANELQLLVLDGASIRHLTLSSDDGRASTYPDLGISSAGQAAVTWLDKRDGNEEVYLAALPLADLLAGASLPAQRITRTPAASIGAYLAWNGERLGLAWCDETGGAHELYAQIFSAKGQALTRVRQITHTPAASLIPSVRPWGRGFLIGWNEYGPGTGLGHAEDPPSVAMTYRLR